MMGCLRPRRPSLWWSFFISLLPHEFDLAIGSVDDRLALLPVRVDIDASVLHESDKFVSQGECETSVGINDLNITGFKKTYKDAH